MKISIEKPLTTKNMTSMRRITLNKKTKQFSKKEFTFTNNSLVAK